jgi:hypothetical protein
MDNLISMLLGLWPDDAEKKCLRSTNQGVTP